MAKKSYILGLLIVLPLLWSLGIFWTHDGWGAKNASLSSAPFSEVPRLKVYHYLNSIGYRFESHSHFGEVMDALEEASKTYDIEVEILLSLGLIESGLNPTLVSPKGAQGIFQIRPSTASALWGNFQKNATELKKSASFVGRLPFHGKEFDQEQLGDLRLSIFLGTYYLAQLKNQFNHRLHLALAAYNIGPGALRKSLNEGDLRGSEYIFRVYQMRNQLRGLSKSV